MKHFNKKGEAIQEVRTGKAMLIVLLLGIAMLIYILSLSPEDRNNLLNSDSINSYSFSEENLGVIFPRQRSYEHAIAPLSLSVEKLDSVIFSYKNVSFSRSAFYKKEISIDHAIDNKYDILELLIAFNRKIGPEDAYLEFNGEKIDFPNELPFKSITIPMRLLENKTNLEINLKFKDKFLGLFSKDEFVINDISLVGSNLDTSKAYSRRYFEIGNAEGNYLDSSKISFLTSCRRDSKLSINFNGFVIFEEAIPCAQTKLPERPFKVNIPVEVLRFGENEVVFSTSDGDFTVDKIMIENNLKEIPLKTFEFTIPERVMEEIDSSEKKVFLEIETVKSEQDFVLNINNHKYPVEKIGHISIVDISEYILKNNVVWIDTDEIINIKSIKAFFE